MSYLVLRNAADAEEITADTLWTAWRKIGSLREPDRIRPWLLRIAIRLALRRRVRRPQVRTLPLDSAPPYTSAGPSIDPVVLRQALDSLPPRMRAVVALHHVAGLTVAETAAAVGRSENTVKSQLREALARLRRALAEDEPGLAAVPREEPS